MPWPLWEDEGAGRAEVSHCGVGKSHYRVSYSKDVEVPWSLRQDGLEGVRQKRDGWEEGRAAAGLRPEVIKDPLEGASCLHSLPPCPGDALKSSEGIVGSSWEEESSYQGCTAGQEQGRAGQGRAVLPGTAFL